MFVVSDERQPLDLTDDQAEALFKHLASLAGNSDAAAAVH
jgi:hypothetical protein